MPSFASPAASVRLHLLVLPLVVALALPTGAHGASGDLDASFGVGGVAILPIGVHSYANAVAVQGDGKILVAGYVFTANPGDMAVVRLDDVGAPDPSFGTGGVVLLPAGKQGIAQAIAIQPDSKIVVAGGAFVAPDVLDYDFRLARLLPADGQPDPGFGTGGVVVTPSAGTIGATALVVQPDGKIVAAGDGKKKVAARNPNRDFIVTRHLADGNPDPSFDDDGRAVVSMGKRIDIAKSVLLQPDGKLVLAGYATGPGKGRMVLTRLGADGRVDRTFGGGGRRKLKLVTRLEYAEDAALLGDGRMLVGGLSLDVPALVPSARVTVARLTADGDLDATFGDEGVAGAAPDVGAYHHIRRLAVATDGAIIGVGSIVRGSIGDTPEVFLVRFLSNGTLDPDFGTAGTIHTPFTSQDELFAVALQPDGKIVVAGVSVVAGQSRMLVARYLP